MKNASKRSDDRGIGSRAAEALDALLKAAGEIANALADTVAPRPLPRPVPVPVRSRARPYR